MSRRGHYVPISQTFNDDPETWELTDTFGDRAIRVWVEILRIMEETENHWRQVDGWPASLSRKARQSPATVQRIAGWMLAKGWLEVEELAANGSPAILRARNYWKYHKRRETDKNTTTGQVVSPLPSLLPSEHILLKNKRAHQYPEGFEVSDEIREWAREKGMPDPQTELQAFKDYHQAKGSTFKDWDAALRTWLRNGKRFNGNGKGKELPFSQVPKVPPYKPQPGERRADPEMLAKLREITSQIGKV